MAGETDWRSHVNRHRAELLGVWPGAEPTPGNARACPVHGSPLGLISRMCGECRAAFWDEMQARFPTNEREVFTA
jgi:hypothetical protein